MKNIVKLSEEPFSGLPVIAYYLCLKNACKTKVILDGSGLDEALSGYEKYFNSKSVLNLILFEDKMGPKALLATLFIKD